MSKKLQPKVSIQLYRNGEKALSELSEMYRDYIKEIGQYSAKKLDPELRDVKTVKKYIIREAGATAGFVFVSRYPESVVPESIYIGEFYVKPEYRRKGIGTAAVSLAVIAAQVETVCMFTNVHNRAAASFGTMR